MTDSDKNLQPDEEIQQGASEPDVEFEEPSQQEWRAALEQAVKQRDEYLQMVQRVQAEFQNYKKRTEMSRKEAHEDGVRDALTEILPFLDNLERAIEAARLANETGALLDGVEMTYKLGMESVAKLGLEEVPALGEVFDPELHNAVMRAPEGEPGTILEVFQKGYRAKGKIIRYPMVKVAAE